MTCGTTTAGCATNSGTRTLLAGSENALRGFDFSAYREIVAGGTIVSGTVTEELLEGDDTLELILENEDVDGDVVTVEITTPAAGVGDTLWELTFKATLNTGQVLVGCGNLYVPDGCNSDDDNCGC